MGLKAGTKLGSSGSLDGLRTVIANFYVTKPDKIFLEPVGTTFYNVVVNGKNATMTYAYHKRGRFIFAAREAAREKNPVPIGKIAKATKRYEAFRDHESETIAEYDSPDFSVGVEVGTIDFIGYTTRRGVKKEIECYRHDFKGKARPILAVTEDGRNLFSLGGRFRFTDRGFVDNAK
jgi:hypothetical protein